MPDFDEKNRLGGLYPTSHCGPREISDGPEDGKSLKPEPILAAIGTFALSTCIGIHFQLKYTISFSYFLFPFF